jgi:hypothetical protein
VIDYDEICLEEEKTQNIAVERSELDVYKSKREMVCGFKPESKWIRSGLLRQWVSNLHRELKGSANKNKLKTPPLQKAFQAESINKI